LKDQVKENNYAVTGSSPNIKKAYRQMQQIMSASPNKDGSLKANYNQHMATIRPVMNQYKYVETNLTLN
jgi:hypothetical protein